MTEGQITLHFKTSICATTCFRNKNIICPKYKVLKMYGIGISLRPVVMRLSGSVESIAAHWK